MRTNPRRLTQLAILVASLALVAACTSQGSPSPPSSGSSQEPARAGTEPAQGGGGEAEEEGAELLERIEAFHEAQESGTAGVSARVASNPAPGWSGEQVVDRTTDDWEPAIAADPNDPYVYLLVTRIGEPKPCPGNCPSAYMALKRSTDGGATWSAAKVLCPCKGSWQYDPMIEVVPDTGDVYVAYLNGFNVVFLRSTDHGRTWSAPVKVYGNVSWNDKPALAMSDNGRDVYISFNGPTGGDPWMAQSHDFGKTWTQTKLVDSSRYYFAYDADVLRDGTVVFSESAIFYTAPGTAPEGTVQHVAFTSSDRGRTWHRTVVDTVDVGEPCIAAGCSPDFYIGHDAVTADDAGNLVFTYDGATHDLGPQQIFVRTSDDGGATWSARTVLSKLGENATSPTIESVGHGDVRLWYMQTAKGDDPDAWNVWYRSSTNGGTSWTAPVNISDATGGSGYKTPDGFAEVYGDYGELCITDTGAAIAAWGEGSSWTGPGGVWVNRQL
jgi:hypothetical protein